MSIIVFKPARGRTKVGLCHVPDEAKHTSAQERQKHAEHEGANVAVCAQNKLGGGKDATRSRYKEVQD